MWGKLWGFMDRFKLAPTKITPKMKPGTYRDGRGLMLIVGESGARSWILRLQANGKRRDYGLGSAHDVSLAEAREKADEIRRAVKAGRDVIGEKREAKRLALAIPSFKIAAETAHGEQQASWRNEKHRQDWLSSLRLYAFDQIGEMRVDQITPQHIKAVLLPVWLEKPETARRLRQRLRAVMAWAAAEGHCQPLDMTLVDASMPKQPRREGHFAAMAWGDVPAFYMELRKGETTGRRALAFTILTAARSGETRGATWEEIDFDAAEWRIPADRMKAGREHVVPLSAPALEILAAMKGEAKPEPGAIIFAGRKGEAVSDMTLTKVMRDMGRTETVHGFRSAFKDWASEATAFPDAVSEAALAHVDGNKTRAAYRRTDFLAKRAQMMAAWAGYLEGKAGKVANLGQHRARKAASAA